jgi:hypothetical protein
MVSPIGVEKIKEIITSLTSQRDTVQHQLDAMCLLLNTIESKTSGVVRMSEFNQTGLKHTFVEKLKEEVGTYLTSQSTSLNKKTSTPTVEKIFDIIYSMESKLPAEYVLEYTYSVKILSTDCDIACYIVKYQSLEYLVSWNKTDQLGNTDIPVCIWTNRKDADTKVSVMELYFSQLGGTDLGRFIFLKK